MSERVGRSIYALEALVIGLPTLAFSIPTVLAGGLLLTAGLAYVEPPALADLATRAWWTDAMGVAAWSLCVAGGIAGIVAWFVLSCLYLSGGRKALREAGGEWWFALFCGIAVAGLLLWWSMGSHEIRSMRWRWFLGPGLILPALHLSYLRLRSPH